MAWTWRRRKYDHGTTHAVKQLHIPEHLNPQGCSFCIFSIRLTSRHTAMLRHPLTYKRQHPGNPWLTSTTASAHARGHVAHLRQKCRNSKSAMFQEKLFKVSKCYTRNFLWVQRRHNCSPAASFANCAMTLYLLKLHLQTLLSIPITQKCQILSCDTLVANERHVDAPFLMFISAL
jgi:hypothetical protein